MHLLYPRIRWILIPAMLGHAVVGAIIAGVYGIIHDQITYSISEEYFTRLKFIQFSYADFGFSPRFFVAEIGFLATWWVGFLSGWFIARITVPAFPRSTAIRHSARGFLMILGSAFTASLIGYVLGVLHGSDFSSWETFTSTLGVLDLASFVRVAYIHNAGYIGALLGLVGAVIYLKRLKRRSLQSNPS